MTAVTLAPTQTPWRVADRLELVAKDAIAEDVCLLTLRDPGGARLPDWTAGSHIDLVLPGNVIRQYSLCGDRWNAYEYQVAVLRESAGRGGSVTVHDHLEVGDQVGFGGPRNNFPMAPAESYLFIAGGIGITPIIPMLHQAELLGATWSLLYGGRARSSMAFLDQLDTGDERTQIRPQDEFGLLDLGPQLESIAVDTKVYACGPPPLLSAINEFTTNWSEGRLRTERFVAKEQGKPARTEPFEVELRRSGTRITVAPGTTVLDAVAAAGARVLSSCRQGICGTCEAVVVQGEVDHRDSLLSEQDRARGDCMFLCVSRSLSDELVLDL